MWLSKDLGRSSDLEVMTTEFNVSMLLFKNIHCESKKKKEQEKKSHLWARPRQAAGWKPQSLVSPMIAIFLSV